MEIRDLEFLDRLEAMARIESDIALAGSLEKRRRPAGIQCRKLVLEHG